MRCGKRTLQITVEAISTMTAEASSTPTDDGADGAAFVARYVSLIAAHLDNQAAAGIRSCSDLVGDDRKAHRIPAGGTEYVALDLPGISFSYKKRSGAKEFPEKLCRRGQDSVVGAAQLARFGAFLNGQP